MRNILQHPVTTAEKIAALRRAIALMNEPVDEDLVPIGDIAPYALRCVLDDYLASHLSGTESVSFRITDHLREDDPAAYVLKSESDVAIKEAAVYLSGLADSISDGRKSLRNADIARLLCLFYGFEPSSPVEDAREVDVAAEAKLYKSEGIKTAEFDTLMQRQDLQRPGVIREISMTLRHRRAD
jgi:hypothetical protein